MTGLDSTRTRPLTLVTGGTGKTGSRVAAGLAARGLPVRLGSRGNSPAFDWTAPASWGPALEGVGAVYLAYQPDLAAPGATETLAAFTRQAVAAGVRRLVLLSGRGEPAAEAGERVVREAGVDWTVLRASWFDQNFSESFLLEAVRAGELVLPAGPVPEPFVDVEDIAEIAVEALTPGGPAERHVGRLYELTGPRALTFAEACGAIAAASGRPLLYREVAPSAFAAALEAVGEAPQTVALLIELFTEVLDGRNAAPADGVREALGRPARDFADYARRTAASGVWGVPAAAA